MEFQQIIDRALQIRKKYGEFEKEKYGRYWNNEEIMLGFIGDVGDLAKLVTSKSGVRNIESVDDKLKHELSDCLWCVIVLANSYGINLEKEFLGTMNQLDNQLEV